MTTIQVKMAMEMTATPMTTTPIEAVTRPPGTE